MINRLRIFSILSGIIVFCFNRGNSQSMDYGHYTPLKCAGTPPADFLKPSYEKYYNDVADIRKNKSSSRKDRKLEKEFSFLTNYKIDDILLSGRVLYGNQVSNYINLIADKLLEKEPELKDKMRFYLLNVPSANALSTNKGIIFVTTGLIAQLENEAQLAFVLAHEISHYKLNHSFESFKRTKDILVNRKYNDLGTDEKIIKILKYSKENEAAADVEGLKLFARAGYDENEAIKMMDILLYSYLPFDEIPFPKTFFNDSFYKVPKSYFPDSATEISAVEDENDEESSHPNTEYRKSNLEKYIKSTDKGKLFIFAQKEFEEVVRLCRYELGYLYIVKGSYVKSYYQAYLLGQTYDEGTYTQELMTGSLYGMNKYRLNASYDEEKGNEGVDTKEEKYYEGQISIPYGLFTGIKQNEFNVLCAKTLYGIYKKHPTNYNYKITCDVFTDLLYNSKLGAATFTRKVEPLALVKNDTSQVDNTDADVEEKQVKKVKDSKVKKIKRKRSVSVVAANSGYEKLAFITEFASESFIHFFDSIENVVIDLKKHEEEMGLSELRSEPRRRYIEMLSDERKIQNKLGKSLGIDSLIIIAPSYRAAYYNSDETEVKVNNMDDEHKAIDITEYIEHNAKSLNLNVNIIDINKRNTLNSLQLNRFAIISTWVSEKYSHTDKNDILFSQKYIDSLVERDGYRNVCLTGFSYKSTKHEVVAGVIVVGVFLLPTLPLMLGWTVDSDKELVYFSTVIDMTSGEQRLITYNSIRRRPKQKIINMQIAYTLSQVKAKKKK